MSLRLGLSKFKIRLGAFSHCRQVGLILRTSWVFIMLRLRLCKVGVDFDLNRDRYCPFKEGGHCSP